MCLFCVEADLKFCEYRSLETLFHFMDFVHKLLTCYCFNNIVSKTFIGRNVILAVLVSSLFLNSSTFYYGSDLGNLLCWV